MQFSSLPILIVAIFGFLGFLVRMLSQNGHLSAREQKWIVMLLLILLAWGGLSGYLAVTGVYISAGFLALMPGYWLPYVPAVIAVTLVMLITPLRNGVRKLIDGTPVHWLTGIHILRILAIGTLFKASVGLFPEKFAWFVGGPDMLFGLVAVPVTLLARSGRLNDTILLFWHLTGALVILVPVAGLMHIFRHETLYTELFVFPMVLAPTLMVPILVILNLAVSWRLLEKRLEKTITR